MKGSIYRVLSLIKLPWVPARTLIPKTRLFNGGSLYVSLGLLHKTLQSNLSQKIKDKSGISQSEVSIPRLRIDFLT